MGEIALPDGVVDGRAHSDGETEGNDAVDSDVITQSASRPVRLPGYAADFSKMCTPHAEPSPITCVSPTLAPAICRSPASPRR